MQKFVQYFQVALVGIMTIVCVQLVVTYQSFAQQAKQLQYLKTEYQSYCTTYRRLLLTAQKELERTVGHVECQAVEDELLCYECEKRFMQKPPLATQLVVASGPVKKRKKHQLTQKFIAKWPMNRTQFWISSKFGPRKKRNGTLGFHYGLDMAALKGTPVRAVARGKIVEASFSSKGYGNSIVIQHADGVTTRYAHLDKMFVKKGQQVAESDRIGCVGATGNVRGTNGSHLHLEVMAKGKHVDPMCVLA